MLKDRAAAQQKLTDTAEKVVKAAGGVATAMAVLGFAALAALAIATVALVMAARRA